MRVLKLSQLCISVLLPTGTKRPVTDDTIYLLTTWCRVLLEKLTGLQLVKKFPAFHGTRRFITALTSVRHLSLSWANPIQAIYPHLTSWTPVLILSTHLCLGLPSGLIPSGFPSKTLYTTLFSLKRSTCPAHLILKDDTTTLIKLTGWPTVWFHTYILEREIVVLSPARIKDFSLLPSDYTDSWVHSCS